MRDEIVARPFDRVTNVSQDLRGSNFSLSIVTRIVSLTRAGVINAETGVKQTLEGFALAVVK